MVVLPGFTETMGLMTPDVLATARGNSIVVSSNATTSLRNYVRSVVGPDGTVFLDERVTSSGDFSWRHQPSKPFLVFEDTADPMAVAKLGAIQTLRSAREVVVTDPAIITVNVDNADLVVLNVPAGPTTARIQSFTGARFPGQELTLRWLTANASIAHGPAPDHVSCPDGIDFRPFAAPATAILRWNAANGNWVLGAPPRGLGDFTQPFRINSSWIWRSQTGKLRSKDGTRPTAGKQGETLTGDTADTHTAGDTIDMQGATVITVSVAAGTTIVGFANAPDNQPFVVRFLDANATLKSGTSLHLANLNLVDVTYGGSTSKGFKAPKDSLMELINFGDAVYEVSRTAG